MLGSTRRPRCCRSGFCSRSRPAGAPSVVISALLLLFSRGCSAGTVRTFSGTDNYSGNTVAAGFFSDGGDGVGLSEWLPPWSGRSLGTTRLATVFVAVGALPAIWRRREHGLSPRSGRSDLGARRVATAALLLFSRGCSAATLCTFAGYDFYGNTVTAGSLCDGSWVGDSSYPTSLSLSNEGLSGTVPTELALLTQLTLLYLDENDLSGTMPTEVGLMTKTDYLRLWSNSLSGSLPSQMGQLTKLISLLLGYNQLGGSLPSQMGQLTKLISLFLYNNQFSGSLPSQIGQLTTLINLRLDFNQFSGSLPSQMGQLTKLQYLRLPNNQFIGSLPSEMGQLTRLELLDLDHNQFSGSLPSEIGQLTKLIDLWLYDNQFGGTIPQELANLSPRHASCPHTT